MIGRVIYGLLVSIWLAIHIIIVYERTIIIGHLAVLFQVCHFRIGNW